MTPGALARRILGGSRLLPAAARFYRALFVDLDEVAAAIPPLPEGSIVLDVGAGDGDLANRLLARNPGARITMLDPAPRIGEALRPELRGRVDLLPATPLAAYPGLGKPAPDTVLLCDVLHHLRREDRAGFLRELGSVLARRPVRLVVKEVAPGSTRARLALLADHWVSGERQVTFLTPEELRALVQEVFPGASVATTPLLDRDPPNYCLVFTLGP